jgi:glutamate-ammonia-ligase adenylyltransferase
MKVSDNLTFLAEIMVEQAVAVARADLIKRFGEPEGEHAGFAVMAYGKLGGIELSYGSDLDLVFVFDGADGQTAGPKVIDNTLFYTRLAQRVVHVLSAQTASGRLYEIDLRLRPDGDSGLVATSLSALKRYQLESAWTWEHQALVRSRTVAGDAFLKQSLEELRQEVLSLPRDFQSLAKEVCDMRGKMRAEYEVVAQPSAQARLKLEAGGIVDIEFVVQYLTLAHAHEYPALTAWSDVIRLLETLEKLELVSAEAANTLSEAYLAYRSAIHRLALRGEALETGEATDTHWRNPVIAVTEALLPGLQAR